MRIVDSARASTSYPRRKSLWGKIAHSAAILFFMGSAAHSANFTPNAIAVLQSRAEAGDASAQLQLIDFYLNERRPPDCDNAKKWYIAGIHNIQTNFRIAIHNTKTPIQTWCGPFQYIGADGEPVDAPYIDSDNDTAEATGFFKRYYFLFGLSFIVIVVLGLSFAIRTFFRPNTKYIDPKKWWLDPIIGEYYPVTFISNDGILVNRISYSERYTNYLKEKKSLIWLRWRLPAWTLIAIACGYITLFVWYSNNLKPPLSYILLFIFGVSAVTVSIGTFISANAWVIAEIAHIGSKERNVGPPPIARSDKPFGSESPTTPDDPLSDDLDHMPNT